MRRVCIITGANTGIGFYSAANLTNLGYHTILACRDLARGQEAAERINAASPTGVAECMQCDLADVSSIEAFVQQIRAREMPIHALVNNAGLNTFGKSLHTAQGLELHFGVNYFGHFVLTTLLLPLLRKSASPEQAWPDPTLSHTIPHGGSVTDMCLLVAIPGGMPKLSDALDRPYRL